MKNGEVDCLPPVIAGPILRHVDANTLTLWLVCSERFAPSVLMEPSASNTKKISSEAPDNIRLQNEIKTIDVYCVAVGERCFIYTLIAKPKEMLNCGTEYVYDIKLKNDSDHSLLYASELLPDMQYKQEHKNSAFKKGFRFTFKQTLCRVMHGSCRKPHFAGKDALPQLDKIISNKLEHAGLESTGFADMCPDIVLFTGDQVYVDDVAGPMLHAINQVIQILGLYGETFLDSAVQHSDELQSHPNGFYERDKLLPSIKANQDLSKTFFKSKKKPIFTSVNASNHLIALNEMIAMYLLTWSSRLWPLVDLSNLTLQEEHALKYSEELKSIQEFHLSLHQVERALAHVPSYMIFDDHDVTDDWNLTRAWEEQVYGNAFSKRIVGNALLAYLLCQGSGNPAHTWQGLQRELKDSFSGDGITKHDELIDQLFNHDAWHYKLDTYPPIHVLDTRTQRWRSESNPNKPSGLIDWEGLCDLQQQILNKDSVIMVSAAPVYGVKFIEAIQKVFIQFGGALIVDAENWMAHKGTASVMLNIFRHIKTPPNFIILSGDVHYSFVYDVSLRFRRNSPKITQFTCSGISNQFPEGLITWFERLNRWFYGHRSPLNFLTKRRNMSIKEREASSTGKDIVNASSLGLLELDDNGHEKTCKLILSDGSQVEFEK